jgi:hypothetical protein
VRRFEVGVAGGAEDADADGRKDKFDPRNIHAHTVKRSQAPSNGPRRYAFASARFTRAPRLRNRLRHERDQLAELPHVIAQASGAIAGVTRSIW